MTHPVRCLLGMLGTDVHSKGIRTLATLLRERGVEVIYVGEHNTVPGMVAAIAQEDPDVVGLSFSSGGYVDQHHGLCRVGCKVSVRGGDGLDHLAGQGIQFVRPCQRHDGDRVLYLDRDMYAHSDPPHFHSV